MCGKEVYFRRPVVLLFSRDQEDWYRSYYKWRNKNPKYDLPNIPGYASELWHPGWELERAIDGDFESWRDTHKGAYDRMMSLYWFTGLPMIEYDFRNFLEEVRQVFNLVGLSKPIEYYESIGRVNGS
jgi:hypothetical protein